MTFQFLGTGTSGGVPMIGCRCKTCSSKDPRDKRLRSSALIRAENGFTMVIDAGPDFRHQMLREGVSRLDALLLTHGHRDHIAGLDEIRAFNFLQKRDMPVYADPICIEMLRGPFDYIFEKLPYPGIPRVEMHEIEHQVFHLDQNSIAVQPIQVMHHKLPVTCYRIGELVYITDANHIAESELHKIKGCRILVINALRREKHLSHFTLDEALEMARVIGAEQTYLTHISHQLEPAAELEKELPEGVQLAYDGLSIEFDL